jgi:hypothetical protein
MNSELNGRSSGAKRTQAKRVGEFQLLFAWPTPLDCGAAHNDAVARPRALTCAVAHRAIGNGLLGKIKVHQQRRVRIPPGRCLLPLLVTLILCRNDLPVEISRFGKRRGSGWDHVRFGIVDHRHGLSVRQFMHRPGCGLQRDAPVEHMDLLLGPVDRNAEFRPEIHHPQLGGGDRETACHRRHVSTQTPRTKMRLTT